VIRLVFREKPAAADWRQLGWVPEHENWRAKRHQIATKLLIDHRTFVDDDQLCLRDRALAVKRKGRRNGGLAGGLVLHCLLASRAIDQRMEGPGIIRALGAENLGCLPSERCELDRAVDMFRKVTGERGLSRAGIAEQSENWLATFLQPAINCLERRILLRRKLHMVSVGDSARGNKAPVPSRVSWPHLGSLYSRVRSSVVDQARRIHPTGC